MDLSRPQSCAHVGIGGRAVGNLSGGAVDVNEQRDAVPANEAVVDAQVGRDRGDTSNREPGGVLGVAVRGQSDAVPKALFDEVGECDCVVDVVTGFRVEGASAGDEP